MGNQVKALVVGMPKSGTMTLHKAMQSAGLRSCHWTSKNGFCGKLMYQGLFNENDPFHYFDDYDVITQADICKPSQSLNFWPQLDFIMLVKIRRLYPKLVFILNKREPAKIYDSMKNWYNMHNRIKNSDVPGFPKGYGETKGEFIRWIESSYDAFEYFFYDDEYFLSGYIDDSKFKQSIENLLDIKFNWWGIAEDTTSNAINK